MRVLISGASGLVGSALTKLLQSQGHDVVKLVRTGASDRASVKWDPANGVIDTANMQDIDAVVHLAGETVAQRWTPEAKAKIRDSRVKGTGTLAEALAKLNRKPAVFLSASAIGYYGDRGSEPITEGSQIGNGFLAGICREWEDAARPAEQAGIRTVFARFGVILSKDGGALAKMLPIFQLGLGGNLGSGKQYMSWIALDDALQALLFLLQNGSAAGPHNIVCPNPSTNAEFTAALGKVLGRPTFLPVPSFGPKLLFGEMADEMLFSGAKVLPERLKQLGFQFQYPDLDRALRHELA